MLAFKLYFTIVSLEGKCFFSLFKPGSLYSAIILITLYCSFCLEAVGGTGNHFGF